MTEKQGFLTKEGGSWKNWKKRYFIVKAGSLFYSKDQATGHLGAPRYLSYPIPSRCCSPASTLRRPDLVVVG